MKQKKNKIEKVANSNIWPKLILKMVLPFIMGLMYFINNHKANDLQDISFKLQFSCDKNIDYISFFENESIIINDCHDPSNIKLTKNTQNIYMLSKKTNSYLLFIFFVDEISFLICRSIQS